MNCSALVQQIAKISNDPAHNPLDVVVYDRRRLPRRAFFELRNKTDANAQKVQM